MKIEYKYFEKLIIDWFNGYKTEQEIIAETLKTLNIGEYIKEGYEFDYAYQLALEEYDSSYANTWSLYLQETKELSLTVDGLTNNMEKLINKSLSIDKFVVWATWYNIGGENYFLNIENDNIEYFCLIFIDKYEKYFGSESFLKKALDIIKQSNSMPYEKFVVLIYLLIDTEFKSFFYFFRDFINGRKTDAELEKYLIKKYSYYDYQRFSYSLNIFPYYDKLIEIKKNNGTIEDFLKIVTAY